jgi:hypothetical protein
MTAAVTLTLLALVAVDLVGLSYVFASGLIGRHPSLLPRVIFPNFARNSAPFFRLSPRVIFLNFARNSAKNGRVHPP